MIDLEESGIHCLFFSNGAEAKGDLVAVIQGYTASIDPANSMRVTGKSGSKWTSLNIAADY